MIAYAMSLLHKEIEMSNYNTKPDRAFIIDDRDKELFILMKSIVDAGFPPVTDIMCKKMAQLLWKKKRKYAYKELSDGSIYLFFPRIGPIHYVMSYLKYWATKDKEEDEEERE